MCPQSASGTTQNSPLSPPLGLQPLTTASVQLHVLVVHRIVVDPPVRRRNPSCHLPVLIHPVHQAEDVRLIALTREPARDLRVELLLRYRLARGIGRHIRPNANIAAEA